MSSPVSQLLQPLRQALASIPPEHRPQVEQFWAQTRAVINTQAAQIQSLSSAQPPSQRPATAHNVQVMREVFNQALFDTGVMTGDAETRVIDDLTYMDRNWALSRLRQARNAGQEQQYNDRRVELSNASYSRKTNGRVSEGCWVANLAPNDAEKGYTRLNLRNTTIDQATRANGIGRSGAYGNHFNPYLHQIAIVAKGDAVQLTNTSGTSPTHQVSHLCHNGRCFNPDHIVVELSSLNRERNVCRNLREVACNCGMVLQPCTHGVSGQHRLCIARAPQIQCHRGRYNRFLNPGSHQPSPV